MANNGTLITPPIVMPDDLAQVLGISGTDLAASCSSAKINKWAKFKPVVVANVIRQLTYAELANTRFGLTPALNTSLYDHCDSSAVGPTPVTSISQLEQLLDDNKQWDYTPPFGTIAAPYRLSDFGPASDRMYLSYGYNHETPPPIDGVTGQVLNLAHIRDCADNTDIVSVSHSSQYDWQLTDDHNTSPLYSSLAFRFGEASGDVVNNVSTYAIALNELMGLSLSECWRLAVAVQVPVSGNLSYMRLFTSKMTFADTHSLSSGKAQAIMPSMGTNQLMCKLIKDYADYLYNLSSTEDILGNKKLSLDNHTFTFVLPAMLCLVKNIAMSGASRQGSSIPYTRCQLDSIGSEVYSAPALMTRFELTITDNVHFTEEQIKAYSLLLIKTDGTGQYVEFEPGRSASRVYINKLVLQQLKTVAEATTINYTVTCTYVTAWASGQATTTTVTETGSVTLHPGDTLLQQSVYSAPGLAIRNKQQTISN